MSGSKAKCIVARIRIYLSDGTEFTERPAHDKYGLRGSVNIRVMNWCLLQILQA